MDIKQGKTAERQLPHLTYSLHYLGEITKHSMGAFVSASNPFWPPLPLVVTAQSSVQQVGLS
jgi:hypothetical protein